MDDPQGDVLAAGEMAGDAVGDGDRAVAPAGAADRDRQVRLALGDVGRKQEVEQRQQALVELARQVPGLNVLDEAFGLLFLRPRLEAWMMGRADVYPVLGSLLLPD